MVRSTGHGLTLFDLQGQRNSENSVDAAIFLIILAVEKLLHQLLAHRCHGSLVEASMGACLQGWAVALSEGAKNRDDTCTEFDSIFFFFAGRPKWLSFLE